MTHEIRRDRLSELKTEIAAIANCPKGDAVTALKCATALVAAFPNQQSPDPHVAVLYMKHLTALLEGQDLDVLRALVDSKGGLIVQGKWLPAISEVAEFIEARMQPKRVSLGFLLDEVDRIEGKRDEISVSDEERADRAARLRELATTIRASAVAMRPITVNFASTQRRSHAAIAHEGGFDADSNSMGLHPGDAADHSDDAADHGPEF